VSNGGIFSRENRIVARDQVRRIYWGGHVVFIKIPCGRRNCERIRYRNAAVISFVVKFRSEIFTDFHSVVLKATILSEFITWSAVRISSEQSTWCQRKWSAWFWLRFSPAHFGLSYLGLFLSNRSNTHLLLILSFRNASPIIPTASVAICSYILTTFDVTVGSWRSRNNTDTRLRIKRCIKQYFHKQTPTSVASEQGRRGQRS
jgi:hypothetical protein